MKILGGAYTKDAGEIRLNGQLVDIGSPRAARDLGIRDHLPGAQSRSASLGRGEHFSRRAAAALGQRHRLADASRSDLSAAARISASAGAARAGRPPRSRAAQMVEIAKALAPASAKAPAGKPEVPGASAGQAGDAAILVMDEPTSSLTSREVTQLFALIERLTARGVHDRLHHAQARRGIRIGRRITVMRDGRHVTTEPIDQVTCRSSCA
jgi:ABC-type sugar transport system ATPase subunit